MPSIGVSRYGRRSGGERGGEFSIIAVSNGPGQGSAGSVVDDVTMVVQLPTIGMLNVVFVNCCPIRARFMSSAPPPASTHALPQHFQRPYNMLCRLQFLIISAVATLSRLPAASEKGFPCGFGGGERRLASAAWPLTA